MIYVLRGWYAFDWKAFLFDNDFTHNGLTLLTCQLADKFHLVMWSRKCFLLPRKYFISKIFMKKIWCWQVGQCVNKKRNILILDGKRNIYCQNCSSQDLLIIGSLGNQESLNKIDSAFFALCLDDLAEDTDVIKVARNFLYGDGENRLHYISYRIL